MTQRASLRFVNSARCGRSRLVRLPVGVSLSAVVAAVATVATLEGRQLRVTVRTEQPKVFPSVVGRVPIDVVQHQGEGQAQPPVGVAADRAAARLSLSQVLPNVMSAAAVDSSLA